jgi:hypothetical protein
MRQFPVSATYKTFPPSATATSMGKEKRAWRAGPLTQLLAGKQWEETGLVFTPRMPEVQREAAEQMDGLSCGS